jgi:hypothetical protein
MFAVLLLLHAPILSAQSAAPKTAPSPHATHVDATPPAAGIAPAHLVGAWKATPERLSLSTPFDESVWGKNATSVREVELNVLPSGQATLKVVRKVLNARGVAVAGSTSIEQATLTIGAAHDPVASRIEYDTKVMSAERRYPDTPDSKWNLEGLRVTVSTLQGEENKSVEIRFDTPEGRGSFWETLHRAAAARRVTSVAAPKQKADTTR